MTKKEHTTITELFQVLDLLESLDKIGRAHV